MFGYRVILLSLLSVSQCVCAFEWMFPIEATISNLSDSDIDLFCQASGPAVDSYGEGYAYEAWPLSKLEAGQERNVTLFIFRDDSSKLKVSVLSAADVDGNLADEKTAAHLRNNSKYFGDITLFVDYSEEETLKASFTGGLEGSVSGVNGEYALSLTVR